MKNKILFLLLLISLFPIVVYSQVDKASSQLNTLINSQIKVEDEHGHLITDSIVRRHYLIKRLEKIEASKKNTKNTFSVLNPVPLCTNGTFEEFITNSGTNVLTNFQYAIADPDNPIQCKSVNMIANGDIIEYNPSNFDIMTTTVPSTFLDEYIGNISAFDQFALKINYKNSSTTMSLIQAKRFKTDNETSLKFNYKAVLQSILGPDHNNEQPYFKARIINNSGNVVSEFCLIADPNNCIFTQAPNLEGDSVVMYTKNWQSGILDISSIPNNETFTVEFMATRCGLGGHFGYAYVDDICLLHSNESLAGSVELDPLFKICPTFPLSVCGSFTVPSSGGVNATINTVTLNVTDQSNNVVYTTTTPTQLDLATKRFCFDLVAANFPNITAGKYNINVTINYGITQTNCAGTSFGIATDNDANSGWDVWFLNCTNCPVTLQTTALTLCDTNHDGKEFFNLTNANTGVAGTQTGLTFSYFANITDATNNTNPITNFTNYESSSGTVYVRAKQDDTCYKIIAISLVVKYPIATISGILNVCSGSTVLTASPGASYLWNNGATTPSITVNNIGTYSVTVIDNFGCSANGSVTIQNSTVAVQPTIVVTQPTCSTSTGTIAITSPASEYSYDGGGTWVTTSSLSNLAVGTYDIKIRTIAGCTSYNSTVKIEPFLSSFPLYTSVDPTFCGGMGSITITSTADFYSFDDGLTWTTNNVANNLSGGTYLIRTKDAAGCISNYNSVTLFSEFLADPTYTVANPYCGNPGTITITSPAAQYSFDGGNTWQTSNTLSGLFNDVYLIKIKNSQGCTSPNVYISLTNLENSYPTYTLDEAGCNKYATLTITTIADFYSFDNGATWGSNNVLPNLNGISSYAIKVKRGASCQSYSQTVYINSMFHPLPIVTNFSTLICDNANNASENINLSNFNTRLVTNATNYTFEYFNSAVAAQNRDPNDKISNPNAYDLSVVNKIIYVAVIDSFGCYSVAELDLTLIATPVPTIDDTYTLCNNGLIVVREHDIFDSYTWSTGATGQFTAVGQPGNYSLTVTENHNTAFGIITCSTTKNFEVLLSSKATIVSIQLQDWTDTENTIAISVNGSGSYEYSIDGIHYQDSAVFTNLLSGDYQVYVRDKKGCGITQDEVFLLNYPKFFTPNGDGYNDTWSIKFSKYEPGLKVHILDRQGNFLKELDNLKTWDGNYNDKMLPADDYWFIVYRADGREHRGHFTLKR